MLRLHKTRSLKLALAGRQLYLCNMWRSYVTGLSILVIYLMTTFRFLAPVVHYQLNYRYMATVLCVNRDKPIAMCLGKCQLTKELKQLSTGPAGKNALLHLVTSHHQVESMPEAPVQVNKPFFARPQSPQSCYTFKKLCVALMPPYHPPQV